MFKQIVLLIIIAISLPVALRAEHRDVIDDGQKVNGSVTYKANYISPDDGDGFFSNDLNFYFLLEDNLGLGADTSFCLESDFFKISPFVTWRLANGFGLVGGLSVNSEDAEYVNAGIQYFGNLSESINLFTDLRYYLDTGNSAGGYVDSFAEIAYPVNDDITLALNLIYDHWVDSGSDWALVGPVVYWHITKSTTLFTRIAREADFDGYGSTDFRLAIKWSF